MPTDVSDVPSRLVVDLDIYDPALCIPVDTMQQRAAELAAIGPIVYSTAHGGHWLVSRYAETHEILRDPEVFSSARTNIVDAAQGGFLPLESDPPLHTAYRRILQPLFNPSRMKALETDIRRLVGELLDDIAPKGECEFIAEFAHSLPTSVFLALMGWPESDAAMFTECTDIAVAGKPGATPEESDAARAEAAATIYAYFADVVAARRAGAGAGAGAGEAAGDGAGAAAGDDVTAAIINAPMDDGRLMTDDELYRTFFLLMIAGLHTTQGTLGWSLMHLAGHPEQRRALLEDPSLLPGAVEEMLRYESAVAPGRMVARDVEIGGVTMRAGDQVVLLLCSANRDEAEFPAAGEVDIERRPNRHLAFGAGPHRCLGSHLARIELTIALEEIHRRIPDYRLIPERPPVLHPSQVRGFVQMPIAFTPEARDGGPPAR
ncbi:MAG TPA: cytochrome P450 [Pseudonocardia sp.]|nr:cytochrome P450 [Pseudonocardia sp.]